MQTRRGPGAPKGSSNASKGRGGTIHVPANPDVKSAAVSTLAAGESLADLVERAIIMEVIRRNPKTAEQFDIIELLDRIDERLKRRTA